MIGENPVKSILFNKTWDVDLTHFTSGRLEDTELMFSERQGGECKVGSNSSIDQLGI